MKEERRRGGEGVEREEWGERDRCRAAGVFTGWGESTVAKPGSLEAWPQCRFWFLADPQSAASAHLLLISVLPRLPSSVISLPFCPVALSVALCRELPGVHALPSSLKSTSQLHNTSLLMPGP